MDVGHHNPIVGVLLLTNGTVLSRHFLADVCAKIPTFTFFLRSSEKWYDVFLKHMFFHNWLCVGELSCHTFFRYPIITPLCYLLNFL